MTLDSGTPVSSKAVAVIEAGYLLAFQVKILTGSNNESSATIFISIM